MEVRGRREPGEEGTHQIVIEISNQGFLSPEDREKIFEPFYRVAKEASRERGSAGLGLPLCRQLMEEQGGRIKADCHNGLVIFILYFPEYDAVSGGDDLREVSPHPAGEAGRRRES